MHLIEEFSAYLADDPDTSPRTAEFYEADLKEFARFLDAKGVRRVEDVGIGSVMDFRNYLLGGGRRRFTVYRKDAAVRRFLFASSRELPAPKPSLWYAESTSGGYCLGA